MKKEVMNMKKIRMSIWECVEGGSVGTAIKLQSQK